MTRPQLIGLAGTFASGKDTLANQLSARYGYLVESSSDMVRQLSRKRHDSIERPHLQETAAYYRAEHGAGVFVEGLIDVYEKTGQKDGLIINGLRALGEAKAIKAHGGIIIFVDAPIEVRYERMISRARDKEMHLSLEEFRAGEQKEWHGGGGDGDFNLEGIKAMSDVVVDSNQPLEAFIGDGIRFITEYEAQG